MIRSRILRPSINKNVVRRSRVLSLLEANCENPYTIISAPAGYGKSTVVSHWLKETSKKHIWISLDKFMNSEVSLLKCIVQALTLTFPTQFKDFEAIETKAHLLSIEEFTQQLLAVISARNESLVIVFDDAHEITNSKVLKLLEYFISDVWENLHVILITRENLIYARKLGIKFNPLAEITKEDLSFSRAELDILLDLFFRDEIDSISRELILEYTEGWILGILMIIRSNKSSVDQDNHPAKLLKNENFLDLIDELINQLPNKSAQVVYLAAISDFFNESLIDVLIDAFAISGLSGKQFLYILNQNSFFLVTAGDDGQLLRFHHFIRDFLLQRLISKQPDIYAEGLKVISEWYRDKGMIADAVKFAINSDNYDLAINIIEDCRFEILDRDMWWELKTCLDYFPKERIGDSIILLFSTLWIFENTVDFTDFSVILNLSEEKLINSKEKEKLAELNFHKAWYQLYFESNPHAALDSLNQINNELPKSDMFDARYNLYLALAKQMTGGYEIALQQLNNIQEKYKNNQLVNLRTYLAKMFISLPEGKLNEAKLIADQFLYLAQSGNFKTIHAYGLYFSGNLAYQRAENNNCCEFLSQASLYEKESNYRFYIDVYAGLCLCQSLNGNLNDAMASWQDLSNKVNMLNIQRYTDYVISIKYRILWQIGKASEFLDWALEDWKRPNPAELIFAIDYPGYTKIRLVLTYGTTKQIDQGLLFLKDIETSLDNQFNAYHKVDILLMRAIGIYRQKQYPEAEMLVKEAAVIGKSMKMLRPFIEVGYAFSEFRKIILSSEIATDLPFNAWKDLNNRISHQSDNISRPYVTNLSLRQVEIVTLVEQGLRNKEIADRLNISEVTVKSHLTNIYRKLGVKNRSRMLHVLKSSISGR